MDVFHVINNWQLTFPVNNSCGKSGLPHVVEAEQ